ncbi:MAG: murein L,D-transpeptidase [Rhizobiales bacterium]|nr:murein L,D-transpeptidase [Hyphomicrobiales bacterium]
MSWTRLAVAAGALGAAGLLSGCNDSGSTRALRPVSSETVALIETKGAKLSSPVLLRAFKKEAELEVWKMKADGKYVHVKTYPMCRWSGQLGPKRTEGDRQVPEGFYTIAPGQMNPNSNYYLSFNVGYPNAYDRAHGRTGGLIMVHGACSSAGCFSMTDDQIAELYAIAREAFAGGQRAIQMQSLPFRMTADNLAKHRLDPNMSFWRELKKGADVFEVTQNEPQVGVCGGNYVFGANPGSTACAARTGDDPAVVAEVAAKERRDSEKVAELVAQGVKPIKVVYADGGQHPSFRHVGDVSRPDALAQGPTEIVLEDKGKPAKPAAVQVAAAKAAKSKPVETAAVDAAATAAQPGKPAAGAAASEGATTLAKATDGKPAIAAAAAAQPGVDTETVASAGPESGKTGFFKKWLSFGPAPESAAAPTSILPQPAAAPLPAPRRAATPVKPQASLAPAAMTGLRAANAGRLPREIVGEAALPRSASAYAPN